MAVVGRIEKAGRVLVFSDPRELNYGAVDSLPRPRAVLMTGAVRRLQDFEGLAHKLIEAEVKAFVCAAPEAELLEGELDEIIEDQEQYEIVTTQHESESLEEVCNYFVRCASDDGWGLLVLTHNEDDPTRKEVIRALEALESEMRRKSGPT